MENITMKRRNFLKASLATTAMAGVSTMISPRMAWAATPTFPNRTLVNIMLLGAADLRYLLVPEPGTPYATKFWEARQAIYQNNAANTALFPSYASLFDPITGIYDLVNDPTNAITFGIHRKAGWLKDQFLAGNVAIVANTLGAENRRHDHSQLIVNTGDITASQFVYDRDGWGGRLAEAIEIIDGINIDIANTVSMTNDISIFCNGTNPANRNKKVVHVKDSRNFGLSSGDGIITSNRSALARALTAYYGQKDIDPVSPFSKFTRHEQALRKFGSTFNARLAQVAPIQPQVIQDLYTPLTANALNSASFGRQCANLYDSFFAADLFKLRVASLEYTGWDTHNDQKNRFETNIEDIFGINKGLDTLNQQLDEPLNAVPVGATDSIIYTFSTDFGRQLRANGSAGTDHGRGNYMLLVGNGVQGGVHGEMFPVSEITGMAGQTRFDQQGADIQGLTAFERVLAEACDWVQPGTSGMVFPNINTLPIEAGVDLSKLFI